MNVKYESRQDNSPIITGITNQTACPDVIIGQKWKEKYGSKNEFLVTAISIENGQSVELSNIADGSKYHASPYIIGKQFILSKQSGIK